LKFVFSDRTDTLVEQEIDNTEDWYIQLLSRELELSDVTLSPPYPIYRVTVTARNGAGTLSDPMTSTPIIVLPEDKAGILP
jgi:hypothetical protein